MQSERKVNFCVLNAQISVLTDYRTFYNWIYN